MSRLNDNPDYRQVIAGSACSAGDGGTSVTAKGWRKVLYDSPDSRLGDNYTPHQYFLDAIERNKNLHNYSLSECLVGSCQARVENDVLSSSIYIIKYIANKTIHIPIKLL